MDRHQKKRETGHLYVTHSINRKPLPFNIFLMYFGW